MSRTRRMWLFKSEPESFSIEDLAAAPARTATWTGFAPSGTAIAVGDTVHGTVRRYHPIGAGTLAR